MEINAKYFGQVSYDKNEAIHIINGLIGFEAYTEYLPIPFHEDSDSLISLQSLEDETLSFILMNPFGILADYSPSLSDEELKELDAEASEDLSYYVVCVMRECADPPGQTDHSGSVGIYIPACAWRHDEGGIIACSYYNAVKGSPLQLITTLH